MNVPNYYGLESGFGTNQIEQNTGMDSEKYYKKKYIGTMLYRHMFSLTDYRREIRDANPEADPNPNLRRASHLFLRPGEIKGVPARFTFFAIREMTIGNDIPSNTFYRGEEDMDDLVIFSSRLIGVLRSIGFDDFVEYPVRVHYVNHMRDLMDPSGRPERRSEEDAVNTFPFEDGLFSVVQLTQPPFRLFKESGEKRVYGDPNREYAREFAEGELPALFAEHIRCIRLYCNERAARAFVEADLSVMMEGNPFEINGQKRYYVPRSQFKLP